MIEVRVALDPLPDIERPGVVRHSIEPCCCSRRFVLSGETCLVCGRYPLEALLEAAISWYRAGTDEELRSFRREAL